MQRSLSAYIVLFLVTSIVTVIARMPLSVVLYVAGAPVLADSVSGTVWNGRIENGYVLGYPLGNVDVSGKFLPLLRGRAAADVEVDGPLVSGTADVSVGRKRLVLHDTALDINLAGIAIMDAFGAPMSGTVRAKTDRLVVDTGQGQCLEGTVDVWTNTLERSAPRYGGRGFPMTGIGQCEAGAFVLPLAGEGIDGKAMANVRFGNRDYQTELIVEPRQRNLGQLLVGFGFQQRGNQYSLIQRGKVVP
ncbi:type II secretion system protein N [Parvularcula sp. LCG005]|uniref:type II secretion system protein N n=1 Tax=Parvularcula sp. LCG005 TaxID=3078805 RepID=UPI0029436AE1|nr:type II secretion system protein N [Parvularcula sp. LCG005]WOI54377.1 type II secretion system protein N [Parvularcula sp. LCG005]